MQRALKGIFFSPRERREREWRTSLSAQHPEERKAEWVEIKGKSAGFYLHDGTQTSLYFIKKKRENNAEMSRKLPRWHAGRCARQRHEGFFF